jgi:hypothetical protein
MDLTEFSKEIIKDAKNLRGCTDVYRQRKQKKLNLKLAPGLFFSYS